MIRTISWDTENVDKGFDVVGVAMIKNGCCEDEPVLITQTKGTDVYSCQCACGLWCTTGVPTWDGALDHYRRMSEGETLYI